MCAVDNVPVGVEKSGYVIYPGRIALRGLVERWGGKGVIPEDGVIDTAEKGFPRDFTPPETEWWVNRRDPEGKVHVMGVQAGHEIREIVRIAAPGMELVRRHR